MTSWSVAAASPGGGINANVAAAGVGLVLASELPGKPGYLATAQRKLDWIIAVNPFNASTMMDVGHNQPPSFVNGALKEAPVPLIPGAVMNGIGGSQDDRASLNRSSVDTREKWQTCEYWTPMVGYTMWLVALLDS